MGIRDKLKDKYKKHVAGIAILGWHVQSKRLVTMLYKQFYKRCNRVLDGKTDNSDYKYWKNKVLGKFFGKNIKNPGKFVVEVREWLQQFTKRLRSDEVNEEDKKIIKEVIIPYMKRTEKNAMYEYLRKYKVV